MIKENTSKPTTEPVGKKGIFYVESWVLDQVQHLFQHFTLVWYTCGWLTPLVYFWLMMHLSLSRPRINIGALYHFLMIHSTSLQRFDFFIAHMSPSNFSTRNESQCWCFCRHFLFWGQDIWGSMELWNLLSWVLDKGSTLLKDFISLYIWIHLYTSEFKPIGQKLRWYWCFCLSVFWSTLNTMNGNVKQLWALGKSRTCFDFSYIFMKCFVLSNIIRYIDVPTNLKNFVSEILLLFTFFTR